MLVATQIQATQLASCGSKTDHILSASSEMGHINHCPICRWVNKALLERLSSASAGGPRCSLLVNIHSVCGQLVMEQSSTVPILIECSKI